MLENPERFLQNEQCDPPTDKELIAILGNSRLPKGLKLELEADFGVDPWIKRQLQRIYFEIDRVYNLDKKDKTVLSLLWEALKDDWKGRKKFPKEERKK